MNNDDYLKGLESELENRRKDPDLVKLYEQYDNLSEEEQGSVTYVHLMIAYHELKLNIDTLRNQIKFIKYGSETL